jgi:predicted regulator of Ras-like GTPase activity (Roadblock/LC7/MglB family)
MSDATVRSADTAQAQAVGGRDLRRLLMELLTVEHLRGGVIVAPDGLVIASQLAPDVSVEALSALGASLGRELELDGARMRRSGFVLAHFRTDDGMLFIGGTPVGYIVLIAEGHADRDRVRHALRGAVESVRRAWGRRSS